MNHPLTLNGTDIEQLAREDPWSAKVAFDQYATAMQRKLHNAPRVAAAMSRHRALIRGT